MIIYIISDSKKGHLSQTRGLAAALLTRARAQRPNMEHACYEVNVAGKGLFSKLFYKGTELTYPRPQLILCAGHGTHLAALSLARHLRCLCMVCMKPSIPLSFFDLCLIPRHDLPDGMKSNARIFPTIGAINGIHPRPEVPKRKTLILIGGPSRDYYWDAETVINQISSLTRSSRNPIELTTSRRTPTDFAQDISKACPSIRVVPVGDTGPDWVPEHLSSAAEVWVTQDSVSMVYEALSSGAPVGILEMPRQGKDRKPRHSRVARGLDMLIEDGSVCKFTQWAQTHSLPKAQHIMDEAGRSADYILSRFPQLLP